MLAFGLLSYSVGAASFAVLTLLLLTAWQGRERGGLLVVASSLSAIWCAAVAIYFAGGSVSFYVLTLLEFLKNTAWIGFLLSLMGLARREKGVTNWRARAEGMAVLAACLALIAFVIVAPNINDSILSIEAREGGVILGHLLLAVMGLVLVEQLFRNTWPEHRWRIKFFCFGVGGLFAYDFFLYSDALLFRRIDAEVWAGRGFVNALVVPLLAVSAARNPDWSLGVFVSRHVVFHSAALLGAGIYLMAMAGAGYYVRVYGGSWGGALEAVFLFGAVVLLLVLLSSGQIRSHVKVFFTKHFFKNKYDYREEWLRFTQGLSNSEQNFELRENIIQAIAALVESPGGVMWVRQPTGYFAPISQWQAVIPRSVLEPVDSALACFLRRTGWIIYLDEYSHAPERYQHFDLPLWLDHMPRAWLIVPLLQRDELIGFVVLTRSSLARKFNWEDSDLLKTVGRQAASYVALVQATEALAEGRQFEAFNRLSSYVVHDLKNLVAQLSLVISNAEKHGRNPAFMEDALKTIGNSVAKMNRLLAQLRRDRLTEVARDRVDMSVVATRIVETCAERKPSPLFEQIERGLWVMADPERLAAVLQHLVQNAQEATPMDGVVRLRLYREGDWAVVEVEDNGCGMDQTFIAERLFRPFDTTKGNAGMGIGVYETREFVRSRGGDLAVDSTPGRGSTFRIRLPLIGNSSMSLIASVPQQTACQVG